MTTKITKTPKTSSPYNGALTREQFLFYEMRITAKLLSNGMSDSDAVERIISENLFQYPTERSLRDIARACVRRLHALGDKSLIDALTVQPAEVCKQICLYAMMKQYRLVWDFMITVIGEKYRMKDMSYGKIDLNTFFLRLQEQDDHVASWSESTVTKIKQVLNKILTENGYIDNPNSDHLNPILLDRGLELAIRNNHDDIVLPAFNCFS